MSKEPIPSFSFYAQDFLTGVSFLTNEEIGIYIKLLCKQWTDGKIPKKRLGLFIGQEWDALSEELKLKFNDLGEYVANERLEIERAKKIRFLEKQKHNGSKGGRPRKIKTQHKPKKSLNEIEIRNRNEKKEKEIEIIYPWPEKKFLDQWGQWLSYKKKEFKFQYKSDQSQQAALKKLSNLSDGDMENAINIIHQSMANGWKGLFKLQNEEKGIQGSQNGPSQEFRSRTAQRLGIVQSD